MSSIVGLDGPPSWSLDVSETGESTKCPWGGVGGVNILGVKNRVHQSVAERGQLE